LVRRIVDLSGVPVISSLMGIGTLPADHPLFLRMLGMHGACAANPAVEVAVVGDVRLVLEELEPAIAVLTLQS